MLSSYDCVCGHQGLRWVVAHREGEAGDNLYVIQSGVFEAYKGSGAAEKVVFTYKEAGAFGELALMYNCPRAASVRVRLHHQTLLLQPLTVPFEGREKFIITVLASSLHDMRVPRQKWGKL